MTTNTEGAALIEVRKMLLDVEKHSPDDFARSMARQSLALIATLTRAPSSQPQEAERERAAEQLLRRWLTAWKTGKPYEYPNLSTQKWLDAAAPPAAQSAKCWMHPAADPSMYDAGQHRLNGSYCYHVEQSGKPRVRKYCGRAERWAGHGRPDAFHEFKSSPDCAPPPSQRPFTNVDILGRGDHNPPIGALADAIEKLGEPPSPASEPAAKCETCDNTGDVHRIDGEYLGPCPWCKPSSEKGEAETLPWPEDAAMLRHSLDHNESRDGFVMIERELAARVMNTLRASPAACEGREHDARRILERASSWFDIQGVAHTGDLSAKAKSIRDDMRRWLTPAVAKE